jgi:hypothetical protein
MLKAEEHIVRAVLNQQSGNSGSRVQDIIHAKGLHPEVRV